MADPVKALAGPAQDVQEHYAVIVGVAEKDAAPLVAARCDVIKRASKFESQRSRHDRNARSKPAKVKT